MPVTPIYDWMIALEPIGWTVNLISLLWVWLIFFGCAFFVRDGDHVAFDIFSGAVAFLAALPRHGNSADHGSSDGLFLRPTWEAIFAAA